MCEVLQRTGLSRGGRGGGGRLGIYLHLAAFGTLSCSQVDVATLLWKYR